MTTIHIHDLNPSGFELFSDKESYLNEINNDEFGSIYGGGSPAGVAVVSSIVGAIWSSIQISGALRRFHERRNGFTSFL